MYSNKKCLDGIWKLYIKENNLCSVFSDSVSTEDHLTSRGILAIEGTVPGNFELDMQRAGLIGDPFFAANPLEIQKLENRHLWYACEFVCEFENTENTFLLFEGIDTFADIYLNGRLLGSSDNMFIEHSFKAEGIKNGKNELLVHIKPTAIEVRKYNYDIDVFTHLRYNSGSLSARKAAHTFGWDILPRFLSGGMWRSVYLVEKKADYIKDFYLQTTELREDSVELSANYSLNLSGDFSTDYSLEVRGDYKDKSFEYNIDKLWHNQGNMTFILESPALWWPRNMGKQRLYRVKVELLFKNEVVDAKEFDFGIRKIELKHSEITDDKGSGEFCFYVNNQPLFIRGTNWVALDAFHSRDKERLDKALELLRDINCNMVRCWGGNVYEDHAFFDFCDKNGILVWQDFAMGCATYPQDDDFASRLALEIEAVVKKLRQHTSIAIWAGDNECDVAYAFWSEGPKRNPENNRLTRKVIPNVLKRIDPWRYFLPSSPYVSEKAYEIGEERLLPENHLWGPRDYFKSDFYTKSPAHFASETGYHGCPSPKSVEKFISPEKLWPWQNNDEWQLHSTCMELGNDVPYCFRNALMASQIKVLFGTDPDNLAEFALASQISQGEAVKFYIERFRSAKWRRTGLIWWNLVDGWPQFSDAVVDYYYNKKAAYTYIKRSQEPLAFMMREPENEMLTLVGANEFMEEKVASYKVTDLADRKIVCEGEVVLGKNGLVEAQKISFDKNGVHFYLIEWSYDGKNYKNHYISGNPPYSFEEYCGWMREAGLLQISGFED